MVGVYFVTVSFPYSPLGYKWYAAFLDCNSYVCTNKNRVAFTAIFGHVTVTWRNHTFPDDGRLIQCIVCPTSVYPETVKSQELQKCGFRSLIRVEHSSSLAILPWCQTGQTNKRHNLLLSSLSLELFKLAWCMFKVELTVSFTRFMQTKLCTFNTWSHAKWMDCLCILPSHLLCNHNPS